MSRGAGQIGSPKFTSMPTDKRARPKAPTSRTRTPGYSSPSPSRMIEAMTVSGSKTTPSLRSIAAVARTRLLTSSESFGKPVACRSMSLVGRRAANAASKTPPFNTKSSRWSDAAIRASSASRTYKGLELLHVAAGLPRKFLDRESCVADRRAVFWFRRQSRISSAVCNAGRAFGKALAISRIRDGLFPRVRSHRLRAPMARSLPQS